MATVKFLLSKKPDKSTGKAHILLRFVGGRNIDTRVSTNIFINPAKWRSEKKNVVIPRIETEEQKELLKIQRQLDELESSIINEFHQADKSKINTIWLEDIVTRIVNPGIPTIPKESIVEKKSGLLDYVQLFVDNSEHRMDKKTGRSLTYSNRQQYKATQKHLIKFAEVQKKNDFEFKDVNEAFYKKFVEYLKKPIPAKDTEGNLLFTKDGIQIFEKESFTLNSVGKHVRILKLMLNDAPMEIKAEIDISKFHVFTEEIDSVYLNEEELSALRDVDLKAKPHLDVVRDWFLILCWTGCRFSDLDKVIKFKSNDDFITLRQQKTNNKVKIPMHPIVREIFKKYDNKIPKLISNQKFNDYIKLVVAEAGITEPESFTRTVAGKIVTTKLPKNELVSTHTARRSFCTNMYKLGLPTLMIMSISGHKTEKSFLKYIKVKQEEHADMMLNKWIEIYGNFK